MAVVVTATVLLLVAVARPGHAQAGCTKDTDCKGNRVCEDGRCVEPPAAAAEPPPGLSPCQKDTDCDGDLVCEHRVCVAAGAPPASQIAAATEPQPTEPELAAADTEPPEPEYEESPPQPDPADVWISGFWDWVSDQWLWRPGAWRRPPAGLAYVAPHYEVVRGKVAYVRGHWGSPKARERSYGGRVLRFKAPARPTGWVKGARPVVRPSPGLKVGKRLATSYRPAGKATHQFVVPPPRPKPTVTPVVGAPRPVTPAAVVPRPGAPRVDPAARPGPTVQRPPSPSPTTSAGTRTPPRPLGLDSKEGTRCH